MPVVPMSLEGPLAWALAALGGAGIAWGLGRRSQSRHRQRLLAQLEDQVASRTAQLERTNRVLERAMDQANRFAAAADEASRAKGTFLAQISHEVRTPMNGVLGLLDLLEGSPLDVQQRALVVTARESAETLLALLDHILDFSRAESGALSVEEAPFELRAVLGDCLGVLAPRAQAQGLSLHASTDAHVPIRLLGDASRLRQILLNLLTNALKFTPQGSIQVRAQSVGTSQGRLLLRLTVTDTGIGVPEAMRERIFEPFTQAEAGTSRRFGGSGLGLAICRALVETMGGHIGCQPGEGRGSTFWVIVPLRLEEGGPLPEPEAQPAPEPPAAGASRRVLVVEDGATNREVARAMLLSLGLDPTCVPGGREALALLRTDSFDLVLLDIEMPDLDGPETLARLRRGEAGEAQHDLPVLFVTAHAAPPPSTVEAQGLIRKPLRLHGLATALAAHLPGYRPPLSLDAESDPTADFDPAALFHRVGGSLDAYQQVLDLFEADGAATLADLARALDAHQIETVAHLTHRLKGSAANVGAHRLSQEAAQLEAAARLGSLGETSVTFTRMEQLMKEAEAAYRAWRPTAETDERRMG